MRSDVGGQLDDSRAVADGLEPVVHEVPHYEQVDDLRGHEPVAHVLREQTHRGLRVQLGVGEYPEDNEEDSRDALRCHEMGGVRLDISLLHMSGVTLFLNSTN